MILGVRGGECFGHKTDCIMQNAQLGYNYLKYDSGWPVVLEGIVIESGASILSRSPGLWSLLIMSGMWSCLAAIDCNRESSLLIPCF